MGRSGLTWGAAQRRCLHLAAGGHLADLKTPDELLFVSSRILRGSNLLLLWTGLSDQQVTKTVHLFIRVGEKSLFNDRYRVGFWFILTFLLCSSSGGGTASLDGRFSS